MKIFTESKTLPFILKSIRMYQLEGVLTCHFELGYPIELFFREGELVHINQQEAAHTPYKLLDFILKWVTFNVEWRTESFKITNPNVSKVVWESFQEALQGLTQDGAFLAPELTQLDSAFFGKLPARPQKPQIEAQANGPLPVKLNPSANLQNSPVDSSKRTSQNPKSRYTIETNLLLPPGPRQEQLEELLKNVDFKTQMEMLGHSRFTGCIYYRLGDYGTSPIQYGLVLLMDGKPSDIIYHPGPRAASQNGPTAFQTLSELELTPEIYKVDIRVLKAYRGLVAPEDNTRIYLASNSNFAKVLNAFKQSGRDGVVLLYFDILKLHYFMMFEKGLQIGIFGTDANSGRLQPLSAPLALPTNEQEATMTVQLVARNSEVLVGATPPTNKSVLNQSSILPFSPQPANAQSENDSVDWNGMLIDLNARLEKPFEPSGKQPVTSNFENDDNPYDF